MKHVARVIVTPELLAQALCFPDGTEIGAVSFQDDQDGRYVVMTVRHDGLRAVDEGAAPPVATPRFQRDAAHPRPGITFLDWGQET